MVQGLVPQYSACVSNECQVGPSFILLLEHQIRVQLLTIRFKSHWQAMCCLCGLHMSDTTTFTPPFLLWIRHWPRLAGFLPLRQALAAAVCLCVESTANTPGRTIFGTERLHGREAGFKSQSSIKKGCTQHSVRGDFVQNPLKKNMHTRTNTRVNLV